MAAGTRYRYKGKFITAAKAAKLSNLPGTKKRVTTEYTWKGKADTIRPGYLPSMEKQVTAALARSRAEAAAKRPPVKKEADYQREYRRQLDRKREEEKLLDLARRAVRVAEREDVTIEDAYDSFAGEIPVFDYFDADDLVRYAEEVQEGFEEEFDFNMADLEDEDHYEGGK